MNIKPAVANWQLTKLNVIIVCNHLCSVLLSSMWEVCNMLYYADVCSYICTVNSDRPKHHDDVHHWWRSWSCDYHSYHRYHRSECLCLQKMYR